MTKNKVLRKAIGKKVDIRKRGGIYPGGTIEDVKISDDGLVRYLVNGKWYISPHLFPRPDGAVTHYSIGR